MLVLHAITISHSQRQDSFRQAKAVQSSSIDCLLTGIYIRYEHQQSSHKLLIKDKSDSRTEENTG